MAHLVEYMDAKGQKADEKITRYANENRKYKIVQKGVSIALEKTLCMNRYILGH